METRHWPRPSFLDSCGVLHSVICTDRRFRKHHFADEMKCSLITIIHVPPGLGAAAS